MKTPDEVRREYVEKWLEKASNDLKAAEHLLAVSGLSDIICFHSQQAVEKYLKAVLADQQVEIPKTHDLEALLELTGLGDAEIGMSVDDITTLTRYSAESRYPVNLPMLSLEDANNALELAKKVRDAIRKVLDL